MKNSSNRGWIRSSSKCDRLPGNGRSAVAILLVAACSSTPGQPASEPQPVVDAGTPVDSSFTPTPIPDDDAGGDAGDDAASDASTTTGCGRSFASLDSAIDALPSEIDAGTLKGLAFGITSAKCGRAYTKLVAPYDESTVVPIASASKMPAATAIMTLVDAGKLSLDARPADVIPEWPKEVTATDKHAAITLRMLLSHTSGLPGNVKCIDDGSTTMQECVKTIAATDLVATPGSSFIYSGVDYQVAGRMAEIVSGKPWVRFFQDAVATPCGLKTFGYGPQANNPLGSDTNPLVAGGAASNLGDYLSILSLHLNDGMCGGTRVLSSASVHEMQKDVGGTVTCQSSPYGKGECHYGFGWWIDPPSGAGKGRVLGDAGAFGATPWIDLDRQYGAMVLIRSRFEVGKAVQSILQPLVDKAFDSP